MKEKPKWNNLTDWQKRTLSMMWRGYAHNAAKGQFSAAERREIEQLISFGLVRKTAPVPWNKAGAYVTTDEGKELVEENI